MEHILKKLAKEKIRFDCRHYTGYKPCGLAEFCLDCPHYEPRGTRILIIKLAALGDVLRTTAILPGIKKKFPQCHVTWVTDANAIPLLQNNPLIDELLVFNSENIFVLGRKSFDIVVNFEKEDRALALMDAVRADEKRGFAFSPSGTLSIANPASLYALQLGLHDELKFRHNDKTYQQIIFEMMEIPYQGEEYVLHLTPNGLQFAEEARKKFDLEPERLKIGLNTGCGGVFETKRWTAKGFCELASRLEADGDCELRLLGGKREIDFNREILEKSDAELVDTGCHNTLEEFIGIVSLCDVVVSSDSLAAHIAIALKEEVVIFFGATCAQEVDVYGRGEKIVTDFSCSPCYKKHCDKDPTCMEALDPGRVYEAVRRRMDSLKSLRK